MRKFALSITSFLFLFAYGMILVHNSVPHHHSTDQVSEHSHHDHEHHHDHDSDQHDDENNEEIPTDWSHPFAGVDHLEEITFAESALTLNLQDVEVTPSMYVCPVYVTFVDEHSIAHQFDPPPILYELSFSSTDPLRGPPAIA